MAEPLFNSWLAWPLLVPPQLAAIYTARAHLPILDSYLDDPRAHLARVRDRSVVGLGIPIIAYTEPMVEEVRHLAEHTRREHADLLALTEALRELEHLVATEGRRGTSLEPLYPRIPEPLRGFVELKYDLLHQPGFRLNEALLYRSGLYKRSAQSMKLFRQRSDDRLPVLGTPRFEREGEVHLDLPLDTPALDELFLSRIEPRPIEPLLDRLCPTPAQRELLRGFFDESPRAPVLPYSGGGARVRYYGHSCVLIEGEGTSILVDPLVSYSYPVEDRRLTLEDLPDRIDCVVITHGHEDHLNLETLVQLRARTKVIVVPRAGSGELQDPSLGRILKNLGFPSVVELEDLDTLELSAGSVTAVPFLGEHGDLDICSKAGFMVRVAGVNCLLVADSNNLEPRLYERVRDAMGPADILFVGMECDGSPLTALYGPMFFDEPSEEIVETRRYTGSDCDRALDLVRTFDCRQAYVYALGMEPWLFYVMGLAYGEESRPILESNRFVAECRSSGVLAERLYGTKELLIHPR